MKKFSSKMRTTFDGKRFVPPEPKLGSPKRAITQYSTPEVEADLHQSNADADDHCLVPKNRRRALRKVPKLQKEILRRV